MYVTSLFSGVRERWMRMRKSSKSIKPQSSGQTIGASHDLGPQKVAFWKGNGTPATSGKSRLVNLLLGGGEVQTVG